MPLAGFFAVVFGFEEAAAGLGVSFGLVTGLESPLLAGAGFLGGAEVAFLSALAPAFLFVLGASEPFLAAAGFGGAGFSATTSFFSSLQLHPF